MNKESSECSKILRVDQNRIDSISVEIYMITFHPLLSPFSSPSFHSLLSPLLLSTLYSPFHFPIVSFLISFLFLFLSHFTSLSFPPIPFSLSYPHHLPFPSLPFPSIQFYLHSPSFSIHSITAGNK